MAALAEGLMANDTLTYLDRAGANPGSPCKWGILRCHSYSPRPRGPSSWTRRAGDVGGNVLQAAGARALARALAVNTGVVLLAGGGANVGRVPVAAGLCIPQAVCLVYTRVRA